MSVKDNVLALRDQFRPDLKTTAELERAIGLSNGIISQWGKSKPSQEKALKVAKFFNVPVERVYGINNSAVNLHKDEEEFLTLFRKKTVNMNEEQKQKFNKSLEDLMDTAKKFIE
jgi:DNA-binding XRE family transcriptional regulator